MYVLGVVKVVVEVGVPEGAGDVRRDGRGSEEAATAGLTVGFTVGPLSRLQPRGGFPCFFPWRFPSPTSIPPLSFSFLLQRRFGLCSEPSCPLYTFILSSISSLEPQSLPIDCVWNASPQTIPDQTPIKFQSIPFKP